MKHIKKLSALLMCALIALSACITASAANEAIKPAGPYNLYINLYESANQATQDLNNSGLKHGDGVTTPTGTRFDKSTFDGVKFNIYKANAARNDKLDNTIVDTAITDDGVAPFTINEAGTYWVELVQNTLPKAVANVLDIQDGFAVDLPMTNAAGDGWLKTVNVYPKVDTVWGKATFKKVDEKGNAITSSSAKFTLYRTDITDAMITAAKLGYTQLKTALSASGITWTEYKKDITSGADGKFNTDRIPYGAYKLVETQAPTGYALDTTPIYFIIDGLTTTQDIGNVDTNGDTFTIGEVNIENKKLGGITKTLKTPSDGTASIGDTITWEITGKVPSDWKTAGYTEYKITDVIKNTFEYLSATATVGGDAVTPVYDEGTKTVTLDLLTGNYSAGEVITITINAKLLPTDKNKLYENGVTNTATLTYNNGSGKVTKTAESDPVKTGGRQFKKTDESDAVISSPATFEVYKKVDGKYIKVENFYIDTNLSTTATDGRVASNTTTGMFCVFGLDYGTYYLKEVKAPKGYELYGEYIEFEISEGSYEEANKITIKNKKSVELPFTGGVGAEVVVASGVLMMVAAGFVLKKRVK